MSRQPQISVRRDPDFGFGLWPWAKGPLFVLEQPWSFSVSEPAKAASTAKTTVLTIPRGYEFDGASVPVFFWSFPFGYTPFGLHIGAALEHDFLCDVGRGGSAWLRGEMGAAYPAKGAPAAVAHAHFARRLREDGVRPAQAWAMGTAVRLFGPRWR